MAAISEAKACGEDMNLLSDTATPSEIRIYEVTRETFSRALISQIVDIHMRTFSGFFLTFLGPGFLKQLYSGFYSHEDSGLIVASHAGQVVGFLAYSQHLSEFYRYLLRKHLVSFFRFSLGAFFKKPSSLLRLLLAFLKPTESAREERYVELSSIGVLPEMKGRQVGTLLTQKLKDRFDPRLFAYIKLETDAEDNEAVNSFYLRNGFVLADTYATPQGRRMNEYRWTPKA